MYPCVSRVQEIRKENTRGFFYWSMLSIDWEEEESSELLRYIVEHWVTVRGFSFAGAYLEKYKQEHKKSVQKSKGLRKKYGYFSGQAFHLQTSISLFCNSI